MIFVTRTDRAILQAGGVRFDLATPGRRPSGPGMLGALAAGLRRARTQPVRLIRLRSTVERDRAEMLGLIPIRR